MGGKTGYAFRGIRRARLAAMAVIAFAIGVFRRIRRARYVALVVIGFAIAMYSAPYIIDAGQCIVEADQALECLDKIYDRARRDTNLAAIIIALAVTLAAWRPERWARRNRVRIRGQVRARRRSLRDADAPR